MAELSDLGKKPYFPSNVSQEEQADRFYRSSVPPIPNPFQGDLRSLRVEREERNRRLQARLEEVMNMPSSNNNNNNNNNYNINNNPLLVEEEQMNHACRRCLNNPVVGNRVKTLIIAALIIAVVIVAFVGFVILVTP
jgi:hypothetical protein